MNKRSENNISTERILKSKFLEKDKQKTMTLVRAHQPSSKPKLIDLCPQEKLKIGELIKTLEYRRIQNEELKQELNQLKVALSQSQAKMATIAEKCQEKQRIIMSLNEEVERLQSIVQVQSKNSQQVSLKIQELTRQLNRKMKLKCAATQTNSIEYTDQGIQSKVARADVEVQTSREQELQDRFYRPHSKSFEKIMKATPLSVEMTETHRFDNNEAHSHSQQTSNRTEQHKLSPQLPSKEDDLMDELNRKWHQLKAKNNQRSEDSPHSFNASSEKEKDSSLKKSSLMEEIDEVTLNRLLKLKDFSAGKLMRLGKELDSSRKQEPSPSINYLKSPYFNNIEPEVLLNPYKLGKDLTKKSRVDSENLINFYESNLFELEKSGE